MTKLSNLTPYTSLGYLSSSIYPFAQLSDNTTKTCGISYISEEIGWPILNAGVFAFIDSDNGSDGTAVKGSSKYKYSTIQGAYNAGATVLIATGVNSLGDLTFASNIDLTIYCIPKNTNSIVSMGTITAADASTGYNVQIICNTGKDSISISNISTQPYGNNNSAGGQISLFGCAVSSNITTSGGVFSSDPYTGGGGGNAGNVQLMECSVGGSIFAYGSPAYAGVNYPSGGGNGYNGGNGGNVTLIRSTIGGSIDSQAGAGGAGGNASDMYAIGGSGGNAGNGGDLTITDSEVGGYATSLSNTGGAAGSGYYNGTAGNRGSSGNITLNRSIVASISHNEASRGYINCYKSSITSNLSTNDVDSGFNSFYLSKLVLHLTAARYRGVIAGGINYYSQG